MDKLELHARLAIVPPKGILEELLPDIKKRLEEKTKEYVEKFKIPCRKRPFKLELVVDDDCEVCPTAVAIVSELVANYDNVSAVIYNITYASKPWEPIEATPAFRINSVVKFYGIPLDPDGVAKFFHEKFKEAYVRSHPRLQWLIERIRRFGEAHGYRRHPNDIAYMNLLYKLLRNIDLYGYPFCPCRPLRKPPGVVAATPQQLYELNKDKVCPCAYVHSDIKKRGHCLCGLFWSKEKVDEYIRMRLQRYGWIIKEIDEVKQLLDELKKKIVTGGGKELGDTISNKIALIVSALPD